MFFILSAIEKLFLFLVRNTTAITTLPITKKVEINVTFVKRYIIYPITTATPKIIIVFTNSSIPYPSKNSVFNWICDGIFIIFFIVSIASFTCFVLLIRKFC